MVINLDWYRKFLVIFAVAVFYTSVCDYTEQFGIVPLKWIYLMVALTAPLLIHAAFESRYRLQPLMVWGLGYLLISVLWYFPGIQDASAFRQLRLRFLSVIFLFIILFLVNRPDEQRLARMCVAFGVLFGTALNIYEQFHPLTFSPVAGRSMGLYSNIDQTGGALMLGMIVSQGALPRKWRAPFIAAAGIGIVTTFARASMLGWIVVVGFWIVRSHVGPRQINRALVALVLLFGFVSSSYWGDLQTKLVNHGAINPQAIQRLQFFSQRNQSDASSQERKAIAAAALNSYKEKPLLGMGTGASTGRNLENFAVGPHNMYLALAIDHGFFGFFILPLLLLAMVWGCRRAVFDVAAPMVLFISLWGFFSHTVLEERYLLLTVALTGAMVFSERLASTGAAIPAATPVRLASRATKAFA